MREQRWIDHGRGRVAWRQVWILYEREVRAALRERNIVINSLLIPLLLYPFLLWVGFTGVMYVQGQTEGHVSRVRVIGWPEGHERLKRAFEGDDRIRLVEEAGLGDVTEERLKRGELDAVVTIRPAEGDAAVLDGNFHVQVTFDESKERGALARDRVKSVIERHRERWLEREATELGIGMAEWQGYAIAMRNVASEREVGAFILGLMLPLFFVIAVAVGCFYPAVDATAGERERGTWETLMSTGANRLSVATAKYLYVASMGCVAGLLNLGALVATMKPIFGPLLRGNEEVVTFGVPWLALPVIVLGGLLLGGFVAGGMMMFAAFARTFKEGQAMVTPFFMVIVVPVLFLQMPGLEFSVGLAFVPVVNVVLMIRSALTGHFPWMAMGVTVLASVVLVAVCVRLGSYMMQFEDVVMGSHRGGMRSFLKRRVLRWP
jgi:sodium transport system permease protein